MDGQSNWFQTASDVAAWVGLPVAFASAWYARKAILISEQKAERERPNLDVYLEDALCLQSVNDVPHLAILVTVTNSSDVPNAIARAELERPLPLESDGSLPVRLPSTRADFGSTDHLKGAPQMPPTVDLSARQARRMAVIFRIPARIQTPSKSDDHFLLLIDGFGRNYRIPVNLITPYV
jgi:hypothetical protein